jgi:hypothetical protein
VKSRVTQLIRSAMIVCLAILGTMTAGFLHARHSEQLLEDLHAGRNVGCSMAGPYHPTDDQVGTPEDYAKQWEALSESDTTYCSYHGQLVSRVVGDRIEMRSYFYSDSDGYLRKSPFTVKNFGQRWTWTTNSHWVRRSSGLEWIYFHVSVGVVVALVDLSRRRRRSMACE